MNEDEVRRRLWEQDWSCVYCGQAIHPGDEICRAFDNHGIAHLRCHGIGVAPKGDDNNWFCPVCSRPARENTTKPLTICCDHCEIVMGMEAIT